MEGKAQQAQYSTEHLGGMWEGLEGGRGEQKVVAVSRR